MALVGDYSPRTERILPTPKAFGKCLFFFAFGAIDTKALPLCLHRTHTQMLFDQWLIAKESVGDQAEFATVF